MHWLKQHSRPAKRQITQLNQVFVNKAVFIGCLNNLHSSFESYRLIHVMVKIWERLQQITERQEQMGKCHSRLWLRRMLSYISDYFNSVKLKVYLINWIFRHVYIC